MALQSRPLTIAGEINDRKYMGQFFILDREHPNPAYAEIATRALIDVGGFAPGSGGPGDDNQEARAEALKALVFGVLEELAMLRGKKLETAKGKVDEWLEGKLESLPGLLEQDGSTYEIGVDRLPRFVPILPELKGDDERRDTGRALYEAVGIAMQKRFPRIATGARIRTHLIALGVQPPPVPNLSGQAPAEAGRDASPELGRAGGEDTDSERTELRRREGSKMRVWDPQGKAKAEAMGKAAENGAAVIVEEAEAPAEQGEHGAENGEVDVAYWQQGPSELSGVSQDDGSEDPASAGEEITTGKAAKGRNLGRRVIK